MARSAEKYSVICVDDEKIVLDAMKFQLENHFSGQFQVELAENASEALELIEELRKEDTEIPIVISDHIMPGIKGDEFLIKVAKLMPSSLRILLTGEAGMDAIINLVNAGGFYRYIAKPWTEMDLVMIVREALNHYGQEKALEEKNRELVKLNKRLAEKNKQLIEKEELERANKELMQFAYVASHDLKAPLRAISNLTKWLELDYRDKFDEEGLRNLQLLVDRVKWMERLINDILEYSKVGGKEEHTEKIDLNEVVWQCVKLLAPADNVDVVIESKLPVITDIKSNWHQLFQNLISNAINYNDKDRVEIKVGVSLNDDHYKFWVSDNGPGIDKKHKDRIFKLFQTLENKYVSNRTGIGLSIVKKVVEINKGRIWVDTRVGEGATFYFTLPLQNSHSMDPGI